MPILTIFEDQNLESFTILLNCNCLILLFLSIVVFFMELTGESGLVG